MRMPHLATLFSLGAAACLCLLSSGTSADGMLQVEITSVTAVVSDPASCTFRWRSEVRNIGTIPVTSTRRLGLQAYVTKATASYQLPASGTSISNLLPGATGAASAVFNPDPSMTQLMMMAFDGTTKIAEWPPIGLPAQPMVSVANINVTATTWSYDVINPSTTMASSAVKQAYASKTVAEPQWVGAGGMNLCFAPGATHYSVATDPAWPLFKIQLIQGARIEEKLIDTRPVVPKVPIKVPFKPPPRTG
jgi:hypothetical protein